jgi:hypothetical protein
MRVALVGWETDDAIAGSLANLGCEVTVFTRWFADQAISEEHEGWVKIRCPHDVGGGLESETRSFRDSVVQQLSAFGLSAGFDTVHALDALAYPAAEALRERWRSPILVASVSAADVARHALIGHGFAADHWICDHPWVADRWAVQRPSPEPIELIGRHAQPDGAGGAAESESPAIVFWVHRGAAIDPATIVSAFEHTRERVADLGAAVLGSAPLAQALRARLAARGWLDRGASATSDTTFAEWHAWFTRAGAVGIASDRLADEPSAHAAWRAGVPVVRIDVRDPLALAQSFHDALFDPGRRERDVESGAQLARIAAEPAAVANATLKVYLNTIARRSCRHAGAPNGGNTPIAIQPARSRLTLTPLNSRELYAAWSVRSEDWTTALEWLGSDAARASLVIRLQDVTDLRFHGDNAHAHRDFEVGMSDQFRTIGLDGAGRSVAGILGVRSARGYFQPLAHARLCHLPREGLAPPAVPERRLAVRPRSG